MALDYGLRVSQPGYDAKTATDDQLVLSSKTNTLKIALSGTLSVVIPAGYTYASGALSVTLDHGLGFVPAFIVNPNDGTTAGTMTLRATNKSMNQACSTKMIDNLIFDCMITDTTLTCYVRAINGGNNVCTSPYWAQGSDKTVYFKYFIFTQELA